MKKEKLEVGQIVNTFGVKGFVKVYPYVDDISRFDNLKKVHIKSKKIDKELPIEEVKYHKNMVLIKFKGIETVEEAEKLRNSYVEIDRADAIPLEEGQYDSESQLQDKKGSRLSFRKREQRPSWKSIFLLYELQTVLLHELQKGFL